MDQRHSVYFRYYKAPTDWAKINAYIVSACMGLFLGVVVML